MKKMRDNTNVSQVLNILKLNVFTLAKWYSPKETLVVSEWHSIYSPSILASLQALELSPHSYANCHTS